MKTEDLEQNDQLLTTFTFFLIFHNHLICISFNYAPETTTTELSKHL